MAPYHRPETLDDALTLLARTQARVAAGCTDLFPATERPSLTGPVLDVTAIPTLRGIQRDEDFIRIGATTTWTDVIGADLPPAFDMLKEAAREVGSAQIQNAGTIAGNLCNASPAADGVPCLLALDAEVELTSVRGRRCLPLSAFITGVRETVCAADELVTAVLVPATATRGQSRFLKLGARKYLVISIAMVAVRLDTTAGQIANAAIAVGACSAVATRLPKLETALIGQALDPGIVSRVTEPSVADALNPIDDIRADATYRTIAATHLIRRALSTLVPNTTGAAA